MSRNRKLANDKNSEKIKYAERVCSTANRKIIGEMSGDGSLSLEALNQGFIDVKKNFNIVDKFIGDVKNEIRLIYKTGTIIGLEKVMRTNGGHAFIINAEGEFLSKLGSKCPELILKGHTHEPHSRDTAFADNIIHYPSLPICNLAQLSIASKIYAMKYLKELGFVNRIIPYFHMSPAMNTFPMESSVYKKYCDMVDMLLSRFYSQNMRLDRIVVRIDKNSHDLINNFVNEIEKMKHDKLWMSGWLSKLPGQAIRFAWDIHCWNCVHDPLASCITRDELKMGIWVARITMTHADFAFSEKGLCAFMDASSVVEELRSISNYYSLNNFIKSPIDASVIGKMTGLTSKRLRKALAYLERCGWSTMVEKPDGNTLVTIDPRLLS